MEGFFAYTVILTRKLLCRYIDVILGLQYFNKSLKHSKGWFTHFGGLSDHHNYEKIVQADIPWLIKLRYICYFIYSLSEVYFCRNPTVYPCLRRSKYVGFVIHIFN